MNNLRYIYNYFSRSVPQKKFFQQKALRYFTKRTIFTNFQTHQHQQDSCSSHAEEYVDFYKKPGQIKYILYSNEQDPLLPSLNNSKSIQEVFDFMKKYERILQPMHLTQIVLVLWDLQCNFYNVTKISNIGRVKVLMNNYSTQLRERHEFDALLHHIEDSLDHFNEDSLCCILLYLNKMGVSFTSNIIQNITAKLKNNLNEKSSLSSVTRFILSVFNNRNNDAYYICKNLFPVVYSYLDDCKSVNDLYMVSLCLKCMQKAVPDDILEKYKNVVANFLENKTLDSSKVNCLLAIVSFLNNLENYQNHADLTSQCMQQLKGKLDQLSLKEIIFLHENFIKIQEPATILIELQRCAAKHLMHLEEIDSTEYDKRLKLISSLIHLPTYSQRLHHETLIKKYFNYDLDGETLINLLRVLQYNKLCDPIICITFWDRLLYAMEHEDDFRENHFHLICFWYLNNFIHLHHRNRRFEKRINEWIEGFIETSVNNYLPIRYNTVAAFVFAFGNDVSVVNYMTRKLMENWCQLTPNDFLPISKSLEVGINLTKNPYLKRRYVDSIRQSVVNAMRKNMHTKDFHMNNEILKNLIYLNMNANNDTVESILKNYEECKRTMSSKLLKNTAFCLLATNSLIPGVVDAMVNYICDYNENLVLVNAAKVAAVCINLGYTPKNYERFSAVLHNLLIRDGEKISALSYIQCCLALCLFNTINTALIKQVFNIDFMDKLDLEVKYCYGKDVYPYRLRKRLMELNRIVCIDYPEANIPWFHQKYVEQMREDEIASFNDSFYNNVFHYLVKVCQNTENILRNVLTPYGYNVDFAIEYEDNDHKLTKIALLLLTSKCYTNINIQINGQTQIKRRHLEMFGYKVAVLPYTKWNNLVYAEDKIDFITNLLNLHRSYTNVEYELNR